MSELHSDAPSYLQKTPFSYIPESVPVSSSSETETDPGNQIRRESGVNKVPCVTLEVRQNPFGEEWGERRGGGGEKRSWKQRKKIKEQRMGARRVSCHFRSSQVHMTEVITEDDGGMERGMERRKDGRINNGW